MGTVLVYLISEAVQTRTVFYLNYLVPIVPVT